MKTQYEVRYVCLECGMHDHYFRRRIYDPKIGSVIPGALCWRCPGKLKVTGFTDMSTGRGKGE